MAESNLNERTPAENAGDARLVGSPRNAWPEGSQLDQDRYPIDRGASFTSTDHTFAEAVTGYEADFPVLARAAHMTVPAIRPVIEWVDSFGVASNNTQIMRTPWTEHANLPEDRAEEFLWLHMASVELSLTVGEPIEADSAMPLRYVGGVVHYLGRMPEVGDMLKLRPLAGRELQLRSWLNPGGSRTCEWLSELSLEVPRARAVSARRAVKVSVSSREV